MRHRFRLIFASSSEIYGERTDDAPLDEDLPIREPLRHLNDYAMTKWVNEQQCMNYEAKHGTEIMRLRFFNAYGPGEFYHPYRSVVCLFCHRALHDQPFTVYRGYHRVFMYVGDFIPSLARACEESRFSPGQVVNIGGREYRSVEELATVVMRETKCKTTLAEYRDKEAFNIASKRPDITKAERILGHDPKVMLEEGVAKTVEWMRQVNG